MENLFYCLDNTDSTAVAWNVNFDDSYFLENEINTVILTDSKPKPNKTFLEVNICKLNIQNTLTLWHGRILKYEQLKNHFWNIIHRNFWKFALLKHFNENLLGLTWQCEYQYQLLFLTDEFLNTFFLVSTL